MGRSLASQNHDGAHRVSGNPRANLEEEWGMFTRLKAQTIPIM